MMPEHTDSIYVLHVDDEPEFGDLVATYLEREDDRLEVYTATEPAEGVAVLRDWGIDCVISDYDMDGQDGLEFLRTVREEYPALPFILYTARGSESIASKAISAGATDYLQKRGGADQYETLASRVTNAVERRRTEVQRQRQFDAIEPSPAAIGLLDEDGR